MLSLQLLSKSADMASYNTTIAIISLVLFVVTIVIGFIRKVNIGLVGCAMAFLVGCFLVKMSPKQVIQGFPTKLIVLLMGVTFLFSIAKVNKTMEKVSMAIVRLAKGNAKLLPFVFFVLTGGLAAIGPGPVAMTAIMAPLVMPIGKKAGIPDILTATSTICGGLAGGLTAISASGAVAYSLGQEVGITNYTPVFLNVMITSIIQFLLYYFLLKGHKLKKIADDPADKDAVNIKLNVKQIITLIAIALFILSVVVFKTDVGLTAFCAGAILLLVGVADQKASIMGISWSTILLIGGMSMLVNVISVSGGIDMVSTGLAKIMGPRTGTPIMLCLAGLMSTVSSASGVVMPTLIPTIPKVIAEMGGGLSQVALLSAVVIGAHCVTFSPLSTLGAATLSCANEETDKSKMFTQELIIGFTAIPLCMLFALIGLYNIF